MEPNEATNTVIETSDATNAPPPVTVLDTTGPDQDQKSGEGNANSNSDVSSLTREQLEARVKTLTENLATTNAEAEDFRQRWQDLRLRDEALGVEALTIDDSKLEDKVVQAVKELYQSEMKRREALVLLDKLLASTDKMLQTAPNYDPKDRAEYEVATRSAKAYLAGHSGAAIPIGTSLADGRILDTHPELNAVMLNLGKNQGVKEGMHFLIFQDNVEIGLVKVQMARELVSAAAVEGLKAKAVIKTGDRVTVQTQ